MRTVTEVIVGAELLGDRRSKFRKELKRVFDASIPWDDAKYDDSFHDHYVNHCHTAIMVRSETGEPLALSVAFLLPLEDINILYIAGIWVDKNYQSIGLGRVIMDSVIEHGVKGATKSASKKELYISLRTQNAKVYEYFGRRFQVFPNPYIQLPPGDIQEVAAVIHSGFSKDKEFDRSSLVIRGVYPRGIIVGGYHRTNDGPFQKLLDQRVDIDAGDCLVLVMNQNSVPNDPTTYIKG